MTTPPAVFTQFGMTLAYAERTLTAILREHLAQRDTRPETWYALQLLANRGPVIPREELISELAGSRELNADIAGQAVARLETDGLIAGGTDVSLTGEGEAAFGSLRQFVTEPTVRLLSQFDVDDIETTVRTIRAFTQKAAEEQAASAG